MVVNPFPGATTEDMEDFIKPILRKDTENIIIHVGTNDVNSKEPRLTAEGIVNMALQIKGNAPNTNIAISGSFSRADDKEGKVSSVNKILKKFCHQNHWNFIEHNNVNLTHLNWGGLHLSKSGTTLLAEYFCKYVDYGPLPFGGTIIFLTHRYLQIPDPRETQMVSQLLVGAWLWLV